MQPFFNYLTLYLLHLTIKKIINKTVTEQLRHTNLF